jgi:hypothetical protein
MVPPGTTWIHVATSGNWEEEVGQMRKAHIEAEKVELTAQPMEQATDFRKTRKTEIDQGFKDTRGSREAAIISCKTMRHAKQKDHTEGNVVRAKEQSTPHGPHTKP